MKRVIEETHGSIVDNGLIRAGVFSKPFRVMNLADADLSGVLRMRAFRKLRLKEWLGFGIIHPDWYLTVFLLDAKYLASANFYAYNRSAVETLRYSRTGFYGRAQLAANLYDGHCEYRSHGFCIEFRNHIDAGEHRIKIDIKSTRRQPGVVADITLYEDLSRVQPLVASIPLGRNHNIFTHKAPMPASGSVRIGEEEIILDPARDVALMDEHKSFLPYRTSWRWATFAGYDANGRIVALNLGDHDTVEDQRLWNENCFWLDGKLSLLGAVEFEFDRKQHMEPWTIRESAGRTKLTFYPEGDKVENTRLGFLGMRYFQPCGRFRGFAISDSGEKIEVDGFYGVAEMMDARF